MSSVEANSLRCSAAGACVFPLHCSLGLNSVQTWSRTLNATVATLVQNRSWRVCVRGAALISVDVPFMRVQVLC